MATFEPYIEKFNELQPEFVKNVQKNHVIVDILKTSAEKGLINFLKLLVKDIDNKNPSDDAGYTPFYLAAGDGHLNIVSFYTEILDNPNPKSFYPENEKQFNGRTPLHYAAQFGHLDIVKHICNLLQDKNPSDDNGETPLHLAASNGHLQIVQYLVKFLDNPHPRSGNYWGNKTPLDWAKQKGNTHVVNFLKISSSIIFIYILD